MNRLPILKPPKQVNQVNEPVVINSDEDDDIFAVDVEGESTQIENATSRVMLEPAESSKTVENTTPNKVTYYSYSFLNAVLQYILMNLLWL